MWRLSGLTPIGAASSAKIRRWTQLSQIFTGAFLWAVHYRPGILDAMTRRGLLLALMPATLALAACDVPFISKPAAKWDGGEVGNSEFRDRVTQQQFLDQK